MLDADSIIAEAETNVGVADTDPGVKGNLARLLTALGRTFTLSQQGQETVRALLTLDTVNRLQSLKWVRDYPEIAAEPIEAPVFLLGLPRSGTTYFQYLFDRDPRFRLIRTWESLLPAPPPGFAPESVQPRRAAWLEIQRQRPQFEGFEALHLYDEDGSDECHAFLEQSFGAAGLHNLYRVPEYFDYLMDELDLVESYRIHKRQLQCLQWKSERKPWALKYPNHVVAMDAILKVYPDARFLMTHRDPVQTLASIAKMTFNLRGMNAAEPVDASVVGQDMLHFVERHVARIMDFDTGPHAGRVIHIDYYALVEDPVRELRRIHAGLNIETPQAVQDAVAAWHADNPKHARGRNEYSLAQYGVDEEDALARFSDYMRRFAIPREREGLRRSGVAVVL